MVKDLFSIAGKVALVTGAASGLGRATGQGVGVAIIDIPNATVLATLPVGAALDGPICVSGDGTQVAAAPAYGLFAMPVQSTRVGGNRVAYTDPAKLDPAREHRALVLAGPLSYKAGDMVIAVGSALVTGNAFSGPGRSHLVEFRSLPLPQPFELQFDRVTFNNNVCEHMGQAATGQATVSLRGARHIATGNHVKGQPGLASMDFNGRLHAAVMGNVTTGPLVNLPSPVPSPHTNFNVQV